MEVIVWCLILAWSIVGLCGFLEWDRQNEYNNPTLVQILAVGVLSGPIIWIWLLATAFAIYWEDNY